MKIKYESTLEFHAKNNNKEYLLNEFSHKNTKSPKELMCGSTKPIWWNCPNCNSEYDMGIYYRVKLNCNCPFCAGKRVNDTNSLAVIHPELVNEWNYVKNINLTPNDVCHSSSRKVWWICTEGHEWKVSISNRTINGNGCPFCAKRKVGKDNNLLTTHQEICKDWNYEKNIIKPIDVSFSYKKPVWWKCSIGHEYKKTVYDKVRFPECPHCNSIVVKHPELLKEWDFERNIINPLDISFSSGKKVFWKCSNNEEHIWQASPHKRNVGRGCPFCNESKGEKRAREWLKQNNIKFESQKEFNGLLGLGGGNLSYDFYLTAQNTLIEYQGEFHDGTANRQNDDEYRIQQEHDKRKREYALNNNIDLLEIWYWDFDRIEEILEMKLKEELHE